MLVNPADSALVADPISPTVTPGAPPMSESIALSVASAFSPLPVALSMAHKASALPMVLQKSLKSKVGIEGDEAMSPKSFLLLRVFMGDAAFWKEDVDMFPSLSIDTQSNVLSEWFVKR